MKITRLLLVLVFVTTLIAGCTDAGLQMSATAKGVGAGAEAGDEVGDDGGGDAGETIGKMIVIKSTLLLPSVNVAASLSKVTDVTEDEEATEDDNGYVPVADVPCDLYTLEGEYIGSGITDSDGVCLIEVEDEILRGSEDTEDTYEESVVFDFNGEAQLYADLDIDANSEEDVDAGEADPETTLAWQTLILQYPELANLEEETVNFKEMVLEDGLDMECYMKVGQAMWYNASAAGNGVGGQMGMIKSLVDEIIAGGMPASTFGYNSYGDLLQVLLSGEGQELWDDIINSIDPDLAALILGDNDYDDAINAMNAVNGIFISQLNESGFGSTEFEVEDAVCTDICNCIKEGHIPPDALASVVLVSDDADAAQEIFGDEGFKLFGTMLYDNLANEGSFADMIEEPVTYYAPFQTHNEQFGGFGGLSSDPLAGQSWANAALNIGNYCDGDTWQEMKDCALGTAYTVYNNFDTYKIPGENCIQPGTIQAVSGFYMAAVKDGFTANNWSLGMGGALTELLVPTVDGGASGIGSGSGGSGIQSAVADCVSHYTALKEFNSMMTCYSENVSGFNEAYAGGMTGSGGGGGASTVGGIGSPCSGFGSCMLGLTCSGGFCTSFTATGGGEDPCVNDGACTAGEIAAGCMGCVGGGASTAVEVGGACDMTLAHMCSAPATCDHGICTAPTGTDTGTGSAGSCSANAGASCLIACGPRGGYSRDGASCYNEASCTRPCSCGNGTCDVGETVGGCPADCGGGGGAVGSAGGGAAAGGAGACSANAGATCLLECGPGGGYSRDGTSCYNNTSCTRPCSCGNGTCDVGETVGGCPADCGGAGGAGACLANAGASCSIACGPGGGYSRDGASCYNDASCTRPCSCGNGTCDVGETVGGCPADCGAGGGGAPVVVADGQPCNGTTTVCSPTSICDGATHMCLPLPPPPGETCGNGTCAGAETIMSCPVDCTCGNGVCNVGETVGSCPVDCVVAPPPPPPGETCGNGTCGAGETFGTCPVDCLCGNGICAGAETFMSCPVDCTCGNGICAGAETFMSCPTDCTCGNGICGPGETVGSCPADCGGPGSSCAGPADCQAGLICGIASVCTTCGNGICAGAETFMSCPADCTCGNGICDAGETSMSCPGDCPATISLEGSYNTSSVGMTCGPPMPSPITFVDSGASLYVSGNEVNGMRINYSGTGESCLATRIAAGVSSPFTTCSVSAPPPSLRVVLTEFPAGTLCTRTLTKR